MRRVSVNQLNLARRRSPRDIFGLVPHRTYAIFDRMFDTRGAYKGIYAERRRTRPAFKAALMAGAFRCRARSGRSLTGAWYSARTRLEWHHPAKVKALEVSTTSMVIRRFCATVSSAVGDDAVSRDRATQRCAASPASTVRDHRGDFPDRDIPLPSGNIV